MRVLPCKCGCNSGPDGRRGIAFAHSQSRKQKKNRILEVKQATKSPCKATGAFWAFSEKCGAWDKRPRLWDFAHEKRLNNGKNTHVRELDDHGREDCGPAETVDERRDAGTAFFFAGCPAERGSRGSPPGAGTAIVFGECPAERGTGAVTAPRQARLTSAGTRGRRLFAGRPGGTGRGSCHGPPVSTVDECRDAGTAIVFAGCPAERGAGAVTAPRQARLTSAGTRGRRLFAGRPGGTGRGSRHGLPASTVDDCGDAGTA